MNDDNSESRDDRTGNEQQPEDKAPAGEDHHLNESDDEAPQMFRRRRQRRGPTSEGSSTETGSQATRATVQSGGDVEPAANGKTTPETPETLETPDENSGAGNGRIDADGQGADEEVAVSRKPEFAGSGSGRSILSGRGDDGSPDTDEGVVGTAEFDEGYDEYGEDEEDEDFDEYTLRDRIEDRVYDAREWVSASPRHLAVAIAAICLSLLVFIGGGYLLFSGGEEAPQPAQKPSGAEGNPGATPGDAQGLETAENAGEVEVTINEDGSAQVVHSVGAAEQEWSGNIERQPPPENEEQASQFSGDTVTLELTGDTEASFESVLAENEARSWMGQILEETSDGTYLQATPEL